MSTVKYIPNTSGADAFANQFLSEHEGGITLERLEYYDEVLASEQTTVAARDHFFERLLAALLRPFVDASGQIDKKRMVGHAVNLAGVIQQSFPRSFGKGKPRLGKLPHGS